MDKCSFLETAMQCGVSHSFLKSDYVPFDRKIFGQAQADYAIIGAPFEQCCVCLLYTSAFAPRFRLTPTPSNMKMTM